MDPDGERLARAAFGALAEKCARYLPPASAGVLEKAFVFAHALHQGQLRQSGEPYILHPIAVTDILADFHMDETSLVAALLHDVVEDTHVSVEEVASAFGSQVAQLVDGLTKLAKVEFRSSQEKMAENFRKMVVAMSKDIRVIIVKLADRTHNMRTIKALKPEKRTRIAEETLEIYAPIAGRLGIYRLKAELEDLCLKTLKPSVYQSLAERVAQKKAEREKIIEKAKEEIMAAMAETGLNAKVSGRAKHFYSIYKKMSDRQMEFQDLYDLFALRVLVTSVGECYEALGVIHNRFRPVPGRFKDYIAMPKANLYQSLHTTVVAARGELVEVQIRTHDMHDVAENGIAAHWAYKDKRAAQNEGRAKDAKSIQQDLSKFNWLNQMVKHQDELQDPNDFLEAVKVDLFEDDIFVFSPKGDVFELSRGATCLDFAFAVHSDLGLRTTGAKINGRMVPLRHVLKNGDVIEIMSTANIRASKDWLGIVTTSKARNRIRTFLRTAERDEAKRNGTEALSSALERSGQSLERLQRAGAFQDVNKLFSVGGFDDLVLQLGYGKYDPAQVAQKLIGASGLESPAEAQAKAQAAANPVQALGLPPLSSPSDLLRSRSKGRKPSSAETSVRVQGLEGIVVRLAKCCEPLPGQPVIGFVSRGRGVTVHAANCKWALSTDPARRVDCSWNDARAQDHHVRLRITTRDRPGMLANITKTVSGAHINITGADASTTPDHRGIIILKVHVGSIAELKDIHQRIEAIEGVIHVERLTG